MHNLKFIPEDIYSWELGKDMRKPKLEIVGDELVVDHAAVLRQQRRRQLRVKRRSGHLIGTHRQQAAGQAAVEGARSRARHQPFGSLLPARCRNTASTRIRIHHHLCLNGLYSLTQTLYFIS